jgi:lysozyme
MILQNLIDQLIRDEGMRNKPYQCTAGKLTIGIGRNLEDNGISDDEALYLLQNDLKAIYQWLEGSYNWFERLSIVRACVIVNMVYNLGFEGFSRFKKTIAFLEAGDFENASKEMLDSRWAKQTGARAVRLSEQLRSGEWK